MPHDNVTHYRQRWTSTRDKLPPTEGSEAKSNVQPRQQSLRVNLVVRGVGAGAVFKPGCAEEESWGKCDECRSYNGFRGETPDRLRLRYDDLHAVGVDDETKGLGDAHFWTPGNGS